MGTGIGNVGNAGFTPGNSKQTIVTKNIISQPTGTTIHTVTSGKTFYCTGVVSINSGSAANCQIAVAGTATLTFISALTLPPVLFTGGVIFKATSGQAITTVQSAGSQTVSLWGWEE